MRIKGAPVMNRLTYVFLLLLGASSYGIHACIVKLAFKQNYSVPDVTGSQYLFGLIILLLLLPFFKKVTLSLKHILLLMLVGMSLSLTGIFYGLSLERNSATIAVVLLFQFSWLGILFEAVYEKRSPSRKKMLAVLFLISGTIFAGKLVPWEASSYSASGFFYGILSAFCFAIFLFAGGKVATHVPSIQRSIIMCFGGLLLIFVVFSPDFMTNGTLIGGGLWKYALLAGIFGVAMPIGCFAIAAPKVEAGLVTIIGSAELPASIIAAMILLQEKVTSFQFIGMLLILIGIAIPQIQTRNSKLESYKSV